MCAGPGRSLIVYLDLGCPRVRGRLARAGRPRGAPVRAPLPDRLAAPALAGAPRGGRGGIAAGPGGLLVVRRLDLRRPRPPGRPAPLGTRRASSGSTSSASSATADPIEVARPRAFGATSRAGSRARRRWRRLRGLADRQQEHQGQRRQVQADQGWRGRPARHDRRETASRTRGTTTGAIEAGVRRLSGSLRRHRRRLGSSATMARRTSPSRSASRSSRAASACVSGSSRRTTTAVPPAPRTTPSPRPRSASQKLRTSARRGAGF